MTRYVAFLKGINVGGHRVKMDELARLFSLLELDNIKTYIQSGNVLFDAQEQDADALAGTISLHLHKELGYTVPVALRTTAEIEALIQLAPFKAEEEGAKIYVTFLSADPKKQPDLPFITKEKDLVMLAIKGRDVFCRGIILPDGSSGFPNAPVEKAFGVAATTRSWKMLVKLL